VPGLIQLAARDWHDLAAFCDTRWQDVARIVDVFAGRLLYRVTDPGTRAALREAVDAVPDGEGDPTAEREFYGKRDRAVVQVRSCGHGDVAADVLAAVLSDHRGDAAALAAKLIGQQAAVTLLFEAHGFSRSSAARIAEHIDRGVPALRGFWVALALRGPMDESFARPDDASAARGWVVDVLVDRPIGNGRWVGALRRVARDDLHNPLSRRQIEVVTRFVLDGMNATDALAAARTLSG
jgi:hypothetical protein